MSPALLNRLGLLRDRAHLFAKVRSFFAARDVLEVDVPVLSPAASIDVYIDLIEATCSHETVYLHSSPEYGMKRLLAEGIGDIYQLSHVFRDHEEGPLHTAEFMMVEWYRHGFTFQEMIDETIAFARLFLEEVGEEVEVYTYKEAFERFVGRYPPEEERDALFAFEIEPHLGRQGFCVLRDFPPEQAALSQIGPNGYAERFELFYQGVEVANGYHELTDPYEQRHRFALANQKRMAIGKEAYPLDEPFLEALERGIPDCCGVAVGFDRLMLLRHQVEQIRETSSFFI